RKTDPVSAEKIEQFLGNFSPHFILNMVHSADEIKEGDTLKTAARELLGIEIDYIGFVEYDDSVRNSVKALKPFILSDPKSRASKSLARLISVGLLGRKGWSGFKEKRKVLRNITSEAANYPHTDLKENSTICSVQCFYWGDCEYQNGGYPCPIRHLDPIFRR
ncbi:hypothetical protein JW935_26795, partial [candidate division KSB1 bacterium]|nr:hypothetical protein [candidate division KSB1 bacterium]